MEHIKNALQKALSEKEGEPEQSLERSPASNSAGQQKSTTESQDIIDSLRRVELNRSLLEKNRIISWSMNDPSHASFNMLRTRVRKAMADNHWKSLAITSPTPACGKTTVALNLGLSLARGPGLKTVIVDLDLKKPTVANTLGIMPTTTIAQFLEGKAEAKDCFVRIDQNLIVGLSAGHTLSSSELILGPQLPKLFEFIYKSLSPDIVLFDLPPMQSTDDALALIPHIDTTLLVAASGQTTASDLDKCEWEIDQQDKLLGVILNKSRESLDNYYYY